MEYAIIMTAIYMALAPAKYDPAIWLKEWVLRWRERQERQEEDEL